MDTTTAKALNLAMDLFTKGKDEFYVRNYLLTTVKGVNLSNVYDIVDRSFMSYKSAQQAATGNWVQVGSLPALAGQNGPYIARVLVKGNVNGRNFTSNIDITLQGTDSLSSVKLYVEGYYNDIIFGRVSLPGGRGDDDNPRELTFEIISIAPETGAWNSTVTRY